MAEPTAVAAGTRTKTPAVAASEEAPGITPPLTMRTSEAAPADLAAVAAAFRRSGLTEALVLVLADSAGAVAVALAMPVVGRRTVETVGSGVAVVAPRPPSSMAAADSVPA